MRLALRSNRGTLASIASAEWRGARWDIDEAPHLSGDRSLPLSAKVGILSRPNGDRRSKGHDNSIRPPVVRSDSREVPFSLRVAAEIPMMVRTNHWSLRYGIAVAAVVWSTASLLLVPAIGRSGATIPFFAVLISTWFGGLGPGVFTIAVGVVLYLIVLVNRGSSFPAWQILQIAFFVAGGAMITALVEVLHAARRRAEANERWLSAVLSSIGDAVIATDGQGRVSFTNPVARSLTGWAEDEAKGKPLEDVFAIVSEEDRQPVEPPVARVIREGVVVGLANHTALIARDGTERPIADSAAPIKDHEDKIVGVVLVFRDVTDDATARTGAGMPARRRTGQPARRPSRPTGPRTASSRCSATNCEPR